MGIIGECLKQLRGLQGGAKLAPAVPSHFGSVLQYAGACCSTAVDKNIWAGSAFVTTTTKAGQGRTRQHGTPGRGYQQPEMGKVGDARTTGALWVTILVSVAGNTAQSRLKNKVRSET